jgi:hypothetical protein
VTYELSNGGWIAYFTHDVCGEEYSFSVGQDLDQMQAVFDDHEGSAPATDRRPQPEGEPMSHHATEVRAALEAAINAVLPIAGRRLRAALKRVCAELDTIDQNNARFRNCPDEWQPQHEARSRPGHCGTCSGARCGTCGGNGYVTDLTGETGTARARDERWGHAKGGPDGSRVASPSDEQPN